MKKTDSSNYRRYTTKSEAHKAFNSLKGIIEGISIDKKISQDEINELEMWCDKYENLVRSNPYNDLITNIQVIISDNIITEEEIKDMKWLCDKFKDGFNYYDVFTSDLQVLQGICHGILADGKIDGKEIIELNKWLDNNEHLTSYYPYDEICSLVKDVLEDGVIDEEEEKILKKYFSEFVIVINPALQKKINHDVKDIKIGGICSKVNEIKFIDNQFCFTGKSSQISRNEIKNLIIEFGGKYVDSVSAKTNYLIVGNEGNPCWAYSCYGRKVEEARKQRKKGNQILIVHENDFWQEINRG